MSFETECFSMNSDNVEAHQSFFRSNMNCARVRATSVLAHARSGRGNRNEPIGRLWLFNPRARTPDRPASALIDLSCEMNAFVQLFFDAQQLLRLLLL